MFTERVHLAGQLYRLRNEQSAVASLSVLKGVNQFEAIVDKAWYSFTSQLPVSLNAGRQSTSEIQEGVNYPFVLREGRDRFMLLSTHADLVSAFLTSHDLDPRLEKPRLAVDQLVSDLVNPHEAFRDEPGSPYRIGTVFATVDGYGRSLKTLALWGDDLANAAIFSSLLPKLSPYRATLRDIQHETEIASVGSMGEINFYFRGVRQLTLVDQLFRFLKNRYITWE